MTINVGPILMDFFFGDRIDAAFGYVSMVTLALPNRSHQLLKQLLVPVHLRDWIAELKRTGLSG